MAEKKYYALFSKQTGEVYFGYTTHPEKPLQVFDDAPKLKNHLITLGCKPIWLNIDQDDDAGFKYLLNIWPFEVMYAFVTREEVTENDIKTICDGWYHKLQQIRGLE